MVGLRLLVTLVVVVDATAVAAESPPPESSSQPAAIGSPGPATATQESIVGVAMEMTMPPRPRETVIRLAFRKAPSGWAAFPDPVPYPFPSGFADLPRQVTWTPCLARNSVGSVRTTLVPNRSYAQGGLHLPEAGQGIPFSGDRTREFAGWMDGPVHRPLVLTSPGHCENPDGWKASPASEATLTAARRAMYPVAKVLQCAERARWVPWSYRDADIRVMDTYQSKHGDWLVVLQVRDAPQANEECDGFGGEEVDPQLFHVTRSGVVRHLGASLRVIDFGDYDGDGRSEVVTMLQRYNRDGFVLFFDGFKGSATFSWGYH